MQKEKLDWTWSLATNSTQRQELRCWVTFFFKSKSCCLVSKYETDNFFTTRGRIILYFSFKLSLFSKVTRTLWKGFLNLVPPVEGHKRVYNALGSPYILTGIARRSRRGLQAGWDNNLTSREDFSPPKLHLGQPNFWQLTRLIRMRSQPIVFRLFLCCTWYCSRYCPCWCSWYCPLCFL